MTYTKQIWVDDATPVDATHMQHIEDGLAAAANDQFLPLDVRDYGAVADAAILLDAVMVSGSAVLTSASNPFTVTDIGKMIYVRNAGGVTAHLKTTIASYQSPGQVTLAAAATHDSRVDGGPNPSAVYGTPNAAAFNAAFTAAQALAIPASAYISRWRGRSGVSASGSYLIEAALTPLTCSGIELVGGGMLSTFLYYCEDGALISLDTYNATPANAYVGSASKFKASNLSIVNPMSYGGYEGAKLGVAIQDNGSGDVRLSDVSITGFRYGFEGAYGSDFTRFGPNVYFAFCDVGMYFGPGSQQLYFFGVDLYRCREGAVFEGTPHYEFIGGSFEDPLIAAITIEAKTSGLTRSGVPVSLSGAAYSGSRTTRGTWFESNAGGSGRLAPRMIWINGDPPAGAFVQGVASVDDYIVSGGVQVGGAHNCFVEANQSVNLGNQTPRVVNLSIRGNFINHILRISGTMATAAPWIENCDIPAGSNITAVSGTAGSMMVINGQIQVGGLNLIPAFAAGRALILTQYGDLGGPNPLLYIRKASTSTFVSGIAQGGAFVGPLVTIAYAAAMATDASTGNIFKIAATNGTAFTISTPTNRTAGQLITYDIKNSSGGALGVVTWGAAFLLDANGFVNPANGKRKTITFYDDGTNLVQVGPTSADI